MTGIRISKLRLGLLAGVVGSAALATAVLGFGSRGIKQPLEFNHRVHADKGMECLDCHQNYKDHSSSGRPKLETCSTCHSEPLGKTQAEKSLLEYIKAGQEIGWNRLFRVPQDVYFSHRRHVAVGNIKCPMCHGDIGNSPKPPARPVKISMKKCQACHDRSHVSNDCIACHR